jgi:hypothetical protein
MGQSIQVASVGQSGKSKTDAKIGRKAEGVTMNRLRWIALLAGAAMLLEMSGSAWAQGRGGCGGGRQAQMNGPRNAGFQGPYSTTLYGQQPATLNSTQPGSGSAAYGSQPSGQSSYSTDPAANQDVQNSLDTLMADLTSAVSNRELKFSQATQISQDVAQALRVGTTNRQAVARLQSDIKALPKYTKLTATNLKTLTEDIQSIVPATRPKDAGETVAKDR